MSTKEPIEVEERRDGRRRHAEVEGSERRVAYLEAGIRDLIRHHLSDPARCVAGARERALRHCREARGTARGQSATEHERASRRLFDEFFVARLDDLTWRIEQLEGPRVRRFVDRCRDAIDAFRAGRR